jgi:hypothetical protein
MSSTFYPLHRYGIFLITNCMQRSENQRSVVITYDNCVTLSLNCSFKFSSQFKYLNTFTVFLLSSPSASLLIAACVLLSRLLLDARIFIATRLISLQHFIAAWWGLHLFAPTSRTLRNTTQHTIPYRRYISRSVSQIYSRHGWRCRGPVF